MKFKNFLNFHKHKNQTYTIRLIIEIDGNIHEKAIIKEYDKIREFLLKETEYKIIRFSNQEILNDVEKVCKRILQTINK